MKTKTIFIGVGVILTGFILFNFKSIMGTRDEAAVMKLRNNEFLTPSFLNVKSGIFKDGSAFEGYTFTEGILLKESIRAKAQSELKGFTGCIDVNVNTWQSKGSSYRKEQHQITDFKKVDCLDVLK
jgi:hypothetical protein